MALPQPTHRAQLYYDGRCPLCSREMAFLRRYKNAGLTLVDIHQLLQLSDAEQAQMLRNLHLQMPDGSWYLGVDANVMAWSFTPIGFLWKPLRWKIWSNFVDRIYQRWAERRYCRTYACHLLQGVKSMNVNSRALIFSYSDCVHYLAGITHEPEGQSDLAQLLKDSAGKLRKFPSLYRAQLALKEIGFNQCWLVMQSPYDEMIGGGAAQKTELPMPLAALD